MEENIDAAVVAVWGAMLPVKERRVYQSIIIDGHTPIEMLENEAMSENMPHFQEHLKSKSSLEETRQDLKRWQQSGIRWTILGDDDYSSRLATIQDPPPILFYKGTLPEKLKRGETLAIIGSRKADLKVCQWSYDFAKETAAAGICVVSGLAYGVDARAHHGAVESGITESTVAVLGGGLEKFYPSVHLELARRIIDNGGAVISQFLPHTAPLAANFLIRNRVIAGLSDAVLVIQAGARSGSLSTAHVALEEGREVLVCPGEFSDSRYQGSNELIRQGAYLIANVDDIFEFFPTAKNNKKFLNNLANCDNENDSMPESKLSRSILKELQNGPLEVPLLLEKLQDVEEHLIRRELLELELRGAIVCMPGDVLTRK